MALGTPRKLTGRRMVSIDISKEQFMQDPIRFTKEFLGQCIGIHNKNVRDFNYLEKEYLGEHDIFEKERADASNINNITVENHLHKIVDFQTGFTVGRPIEYSYKGEKQADDMTYFKRYLQDSKKGSLDIVLYRSKFLYGIGHRMIISRRKDFDDEQEAPFELINVDNKNCFVAHSSNTEKEELFGCVITKIYDIETKTSENLYTIYLTNGYYFSLKGNDYNLYEDLTSQSITFNPLIECPLNEHRTGLPELVLLLQHAVNGVDSMELDDIEQFISCFIVFENQEIDDEFLANLAELKKQRALAIKTTNPNAPAKVSFLSASLDHTNINSYYERLITAMYDITSTPKASGSVTSGGDTTGARLLGNGWESAQNQAEVTTGFMVSNEYEQLKRMFEICKYTSNKLDEIYPSEIEIKYNINMSNNLLVKTQSLQNLDSIKMPEEIALNMVGLSNDNHGVAIQWKAKKQEIEEKANNEEQQAVDNKVNENSTDKNGIPG